MSVAAIKRMRYVPPFPNANGYHWIRRFRGGPAIPLYWSALWHQNGAQGWGQWAQPDREDQWEYCGPCPSPDDREQGWTTEELMVPNLGWDDAPFDNPRDPFAAPDRLPE